MNSPDVMNSRRIFIESKYAACAELFIVVINVNVDQVDEDALAIFLLSKSYCRA